MRSILLAGVCLLTLSGCASPGLTEFMSAAEKLDPECGKRVKAQIGTNFMFGWPMPVVTGSYDKSCNPEQFPKPADDAVPR